MNWRTSYGKGRLAEKSGRIETAIGHYADALKVEKSDPAGEIAYRLGHLYLHRENFKLAAEALNRSVAAEPQNGHRLFRYGTALQKLEAWDAAIAAFEEAATHGIVKADLHYRLGQCKEKLGLSLDAIAEYRKAAGQEPEKRYHHEALIRATRRTGQAKMINEVLQQASSNFPNDKTFKKQLADSYVALQNPHHIHEYFSTINTTTEASAATCFRHGVALLELGKESEASKLFDKAISLDTKLRAKELGAGVFFESIGDYRNAADFFGKFSKKFPDNAEIHFRRAYALERSYHWEGAAGEYELALLLNPGNPMWFYRLALTQERLNRWNEAGEAYELANRGLKTKNSYWLYREACTQLEAGAYELACEKFALSAGRKIIWAVEDDAPENGSSLESDAEIVAETVDEDDKWPNSRLKTVLSLQSAAASYRAGQTYMSFEKYELAIVAFSDACKRSNEFNADYFASLAEAYACNGDFESAAKAYKEIRILKLPHGVDSKKYTKTPAAKNSLFYVEYCDTLEVNHEAILFESGGGSFIGCNPRAIFQVIVDDIKFKNHEFVWVVNDTSKIPESLMGDSRIIFIKKESDAYLRYLATAGWLINNNTFPPYFSRREEQKYLNTWHGIPLKTLGRDIRSGMMDHKNAARNLLHATHLIAPNEHFMNVLTERNEVQGLLTAKVAMTGYPRVDQLVNESALRRDEVRRMIGADVDETVVLYAPTWRGDLSNKVIDVDKILSDVTALNSTGCKVIFKGHAMVEAELAASPLNDLLLDVDIDTNTLLLGVDVLISDYSSIIFDFMPLQRPIVYYTYDLEEYKQERGLYFEIEDLPGVRCDNIGDLVNSISRIKDDASFDVVLETPLSRSLLAHEDGKAASKAASFFFEDDMTAVVEEHADKKPVLFFQGSFIPNGISTAFDALVRAIDHDVYRPVVVLEPGALHMNQNRLDVFNGVRDEFQTIGRVGGMTANLEELWIIDRMNSKHELDSDRMWDRYNHAFSREFRRLFGATEFSSVVCFEGYARFWAALFANSPKPTNGRAIYLHNDMIREYETRFHYLKSMFELYGTYDTLVSVSKSVGEINAAELSASYNIPSERFVNVNNQIDPSRILRLSTEEIDPELGDWIANADHVFVNVARLSPEKDQEKLLHAFAKVKAKVDKKLRLVIVGEGPLAQQLSEVTSKLGIADSVYFTGLQSNPYAIMRRCSSFVFSSNYEGQGLVVLEALVLGIPVVSTDVVGPRSILENGEGKLVENSINGLQRGMIEICSSQDFVSNFDVEIYNKDARDSFDRYVLQK